MKAEDIEWKEFAEDDFYAKLLINGKSFMLRIEQMGVESWWACIYVGGVQEWENGGEYQPTLEKTKEQVLKALNEMI